MAQRLSDSIVKALPAPAAGNRIEYDAEVKGFGFRVTSTGARALCPQLPDALRTRTAPHDRRLSRLEDQRGSRRGEDDQARDRPRRRPAR